MSQAGSGRFQQTANYCPGIAFALMYVFDTDFGQWLDLTD